MVKDTYKNGVRQNRKRWTKRTSPTILWPSDIMEYRISNYTVNICLLGYEPSIMKRTIMSGKQKLYLSMTFQHRPKCINASFRLDVRVIFILYLLSINIFKWRVQWNETRTMLQYHVTIQGISKIVGFPNLKYEFQNILKYL